MEAKLKVGGRVIVDGIRTGTLDRLGMVIARVTFDGERESTACFVRSIEALKPCLPSERSLDVLMEHAKPLIERRTR
jgi:hypothetical protein